jgi:glycosyltransferase involved in cell wall biosynthesis
MGRLGCLFPAFPVFHQTFVLWEVMGLQRNGVSPAIYSLKQPSQAQQPEGEEIAKDVIYLPPLWSTAVLRANWHLFRRQPGRYLRLYREVYRAWQTGKAMPLRSAGWERRPMTLYDRLRGWYNGHPVLYLLKSLLLVPTAVQLAQRLERDGITHLHVHWASYPATVAYVIHMISGLPFSISAHAYDIYLIARMLPAKIAAARFLVTCARTNANFLRRMANAELSHEVDDKVVVNYHGVDITRFAPPNGERTHAGPLRIVSCGQLEPYKGMHTLIDAIAQLRDEGFEVECRIVGEGPKRRQLEAQIEQLKLTDRVQLLGRRAHREVAELLHDADVFALASELGGRRRDVIANVIVEAMAVGLPVVATNIPGADELVEDGISGYLVRPNRAESVAEGLRKLAQNPSERRRLGEAARRRVLQDFDSNKNVRQLAALLAAAVAGAEVRTPALSAL